MSRERLSPPQARLLREVVEVPGREYDGVSKRGIMALWRLGLVTWSWREEAHAGRQHTAVFTVHPTVQGLEWVTNEKT